MILHEVIRAAIGDPTAPGQTTAHYMLVGANLGMTLWMTAVDMAILAVYSSVALREAWRRRTTTPSIVCIMSTLVALGQLVFSGRRIWMLSIGAELTRTQPDWSVAAVIVGSGFITASLVVGLIWRASRLRPGTGRSVALVNLALACVCMIGGGYLAK